jgi:hypothetical protein
LLRGGYFSQFHFVVKRPFINFLFNASNQTFHTHSPTLRLAFRFQLTVSSPPRQHRVGMGRIIGRFFKGASTIAKKTCKNEPFAAFMTETFILCCFIQRLFLFDVGITSS